MLIKILETGEVKETEYSIALRLLEHRKAIPQHVEVEEKPVRKKAKKAAEKSEDTAVSADKTE